MRASFFAIVVACTLTGCAVGANYKAILDMLRREAGHL